MKIYKYFISYYFKGNDESGMGSIGVDANKEIDDMEELGAIRDHIEKDIKNRFGIEAGAVILNFQLLKVEEN